MTKRAKLQTFDLDGELQAALARYWQRGELARKAGHDYRGMSRYVTATDLERDVREHLTARFYESGLRGRFVIHTGQRGGLLQAARAFLFARVRAGELASHNFGRGHISGERFRLASTEVSAAEQQSVARRERPRVVHAPASETSYGRPLCTATRTRSLYYTRRRAVITSSERERITCARCIKLTTNPTQEG